MKQVFKGDLFNLYAFVCCFDTYLHYSFLVFYICSLFFTKSQIKIGYIFYAVLILTKFCYRKSSIWIYTNQIFCAIIILLARQWANMPSGLYECTVIAVWCGISSLWYQHARTVLLCISFFKFFLFLFKRYGKIK